MSNNGRYLNLENGKIKSEDAIDSSSGASDSSKIIKTDSNGLIDNSFIDIVSADGSIDTHSDVDTTTNVPLINEFLAWDGSNWVPTSLTSQSITYTKTFWCEENGTGNSVLSWGNGATNLNTGALTQEDGTIISFSIKTQNNASGTYVLALNGVDQQTFVATGTQQTDFTGLTITYNSGDHITVRRTAGGGTDGVVVCSLDLQVEVDITGFTGPQGEQGAPGQDGIAQFLAGSGAPSDSLGNDGDFYIDNITGDYYIKDSGVWVLQGNLKGAPGTSVLTSKYTNNNNTTINAAATQVYNTINTTPIFDAIGADITIATDRVTINTAGTYCFYVNLYQTSTSTRTNVGIEFSINGISTGRISASSYIRNSGGHNESSTNIQETFVLSPGDFVQINTLQLAGAGTVTSPVNTLILEVKKEG